MFVDFLAPSHKKVATTEDEKTTTCSPLAKETRKMHPGPMTIIIEPLVVDCLGVVSGGLEGILKNLGIPDELAGMQASVVMGTTITLQRTLSPLA